MTIKDKNKRKFITMLSKKYALELGLESPQKDITKIIKELEPEYGVELGIKPALSQSKGMIKRTDVSLFGDPFSRTSFSQFWAKTKLFLNVTDRVEE